MNNLENRRNKINNFKGKLFNLYRRNCEKI